MEDSAAIPTPSDLFSEAGRTAGQNYGQWVGAYHGSNEGIVVLDLDLRGSLLSGAAHDFDNNQHLPDSVGFLENIPLDLSFKGEITVLQLHPDGRLMSNQEIAAAFPGVTAPDKAHVETRLQEGSLHVEWETSIGTKGEGLLNASESLKPSSYRPASGPIGWSEFKNTVRELEFGRFIFRGQPRPYRLRTSFHRTNRSDLMRFGFEDIAALHRNLSARTMHYFHLNDPAQTGAFYNLVQHHGYPTPLLDWTYSPYVAAYFAFRNLATQDADDGVVRVFVFDKEQWCKKFRQVQQVAHARPHFSILEAVALGNERMVPQQTLSSLTNVDDIEGYIRSMEIISSDFLRVIDIHRDERREVMSELRTMGITAGAMFPGLDGACEELKARYFGD